jgi:hypothetical protein
MGSFFCFLKRSLLKGGKVMKCSKHPGVEMVVKEMSVGWGNESKLFCPECKKEAQVSAKANGSGEVVFSESPARWQG